MLWVNTKHTTKRRKSSTKAQRARARAATQDRISRSGGAGRAPFCASSIEGAGRVALAALIQAAAQAGFWKLLSRIFPENAASRGLVGALGFREVGIYEKHGRLDGHWRDVVIVERLI